MTAKPKTLGQSIREGFAAWKQAPAESEPELAPLARRSRTPRAAKLRPVHALRYIALFGPQTETMYSFAPSKRAEAGGLGPPDLLVKHRGRRSVQGWQEAQRRLEKLGLWVRLSPKGKAYIVSDRGRAPVGTVDTFAAVAGWVGAGLRDEPWPCDWCPSEAIALLAGDPPVPVCEEHGG